MRRPAATECAWRRRHGSTTDCSTWSRSTRSAWLRALLKIAKLYRGTLLGDAVVRHVRSAHLRIDADPPAEVEAEGQIVGRTPAVFSVLPGALEVVVPREAG